MFKPGDKVLVRQCLAGCHDNYGKVMYSWVSGYTFIKEEHSSLIGNTILVKNENVGIFNGMSYRYNLSDIKGIN